MGNFNLSLIDIVMNAMSSKLEIGINRYSSNAYLIDPRTIIFYNDHLTGDDSLGLYEVSVNYSDIETIEAIQIDPIQEEPGIWSVDFTAKLSYKKCNDMPLKFNRLRIKQ